MSLNTWRSFLSPESAKAVVDITSASPAINVSTRFVMGSSSVDCTSECGRTLRSLKGQARCQRDPAKLFEKLQSLKAVMLRVLYGGRAAVSGPGTPPRGPPGCRLP